MRLSSVLAGVRFKTSNEHHTRHPEGDTYNSPLSLGRGSTRMLLSEYKQELSFHTRTEY
jgi:hypothetical protein